MNQFNIGDVVQLKSSSPLMTIKSCTESEATCVWFQGNDLKEATFPFTVLNKYVPIKGKSLKFI